MRAMVNEALEEVSPLFAKLYAQMGRPSISPERLLRALPEGTRVALGAGRANAR